MLQRVVPKLPSHLIYPETDRPPLAENTKQLRWIVMLYGNLAALFRDAADVFVAADLFWYPAEGHPEVRTAPDVLVAFGRPKRERGSYRQWEEENIPLTVVFEVLAPHENASALMAKQDLYEEHGAEEWYVYDPHSNRLLAYVRCGEELRRVRPEHGYVSPRLGIRFDLSGPEMVIYRPDGQRFLTFEELDAAREQEIQRAEREKQRADQAERRAARLAELSRKARRQQASPEELAELERLEGPNSSPAP